MYKNLLKPAADWLLAILLCLVFAPFFLILLVVVFLTQGTPIFFFQRRAGHKMKPFSIIKIRTFEPKKDHDLSTEGLNYSNMGRWLRRTGLDELPQIWHIIKGEMSFIGPRPMPVEYNALYSDSQLRRFNVKPGIIGWAQVNGRNAISWKKRFELDIDYVERVSLSIDLKIVGLALRQLLSCRKHDDSMPVFKGYKQK